MTKKKNQPLRSQQEQLNEESNQQASNHDSQTSSLLLSNKTVFDMALREGMGFGHACHLSGNDPCTVSEALRELDMVEYYERVASAANLDLLRMHSEYMQENNVAKADDARRRLMVKSKLVLWEDLGNTDMAEDDEVLIVAIMEHGVVRDVAVGFGMPYEEFIRELVKRPQVMDTVKLLDTHKTVKVG